MDRRSFLASLSAVLLFVPGSIASSRATRLRAKDMSTWLSFGSNGGAESARGNLTTPATPAAASTVPTSATRLNCGEGAGSAITGAGEVYVFGTNDLIISGVHESSFGSQFAGAGVRPPISTATKLTYVNAVNATDSAVDATAVFWMKADQTLWAVGLNQAAFGNGDVVDTYYGTPTQIASGVVSFCVGQGGVSASALYYVDTNGDVWFAGSNTHGQQGNGATSAKVFTFTKITALSSVQKVWATGENAFALIGGSTLKAWGANLFGSLGDASTTQRTTPVTISTLPGGVTISDVMASVAGFTYVLLADGRLEVTGYNSDGELGLGDTTNRSSFTQATVGASLSVTALANGGAGGPFTGAVIAGGKYWATGANTNGQIDYGFTFSTSFLNSIAFPGTVKAIAMVGDSAVFVATGGGRAWSSVIGA